jgi:hypothetical protein
MTMMRVMTKATKRKGAVYPATASEYIVDLVKGKSVKIFKVPREGVLEEGASFRVGDEAEYDSYNLHYTGIIDSISEKTITIVKTRGAVKHRLNLYEFCWRNFRFDAGRVRAENRETGQYI